MTASATAPTQAARSSHGDYDVLGVRVRIVTDDPAVADTVNASYGTFLTAEPVPSAERDATINCRGHERSHWAVAGGWQPMRTFETRDGAAIDVLNRLVDAILRGLHERGVVAVHAATVGVADGVLLIAARSGGGKSTLALGLAARGHALLSDELAPIDPGGLIRPYQRAVHVRPDTIDLISELAFLADRPRHVLGGGNEWAVGPAELTERWGLPEAVSGRLAGVILVDGVPGQGTGRLEPCSAAIAALELARGSWAASVDFAGTLGRFAAMLADVPCARLDNGPLTDSLDAIEARFGTAGATVATGAAQPTGSVRPSGTMALARLALLERWRDEGRRATIEATGGSMEPSISPGDGLDVAFGARPGAVGEVIVFSQDGRIIAHRIVGRRSDGRWLTKGDAEPFATEDVAPDAILGVVRAIHRPDGRTVVPGGRRDLVTASVSRTAGRLERAARRGNPIIAIPSGLAARGGRAVLSRWTGGPARAGQVESTREGGESV